MELLRNCSSSSPPPTGKDAPLIVAKILVDWVRHEHGIFQGIWRYIRPIPSGVAFGTDLNQASFPWVTTTLVITNAID
jgi:hypothetical protein